MHKIPVGVLGASGYAGRELCAIVGRHPRLSLAFATANAKRGETARIGGRDITFIASEDAPLAAATLIFSALPHGTSAEWVARAQQAGAKVVDLSADLRPGNNAPASAPYGLTELRRAEVRDAAVVANPGCYPTAILTALAPLAQQGLVAPNAVINAVAASGVTGAGMSPKPELLFAEIAEDYRAYGVGNEHRHLREMRAMASEWSLDADLIFTPHLLPVARGILATITVPIVQWLGDPMAPFRAMYAGERFIEFDNRPPALKDVVRRNAVRLWAAPAAHLRTPHLLVFSAIDNLVKGAAGQAVQNANLMLGLDETLGLLD
jgi:N-acetyl-gamma-glutamyl-phosphate reductase